MNYQNLHKILTACLVIAPKRDARYYLCGVHIVQDDYGITFEATDGHRAIQFRSEERIKFVDNFDIILDIVQVKLLADKIKALGYSKIDLYEVELLSIRDFISLDLGDFKTIEGNYPSIDRIVWSLSESKPIECIGLDARYLSDVAKITKPFCKNSYQPVKLSFKDSINSVRIDFSTNIEKMKAVLLIMPCRL